MLKVNYESKVEWVARQIKDSRKRIGRLNILDFYYHQPIKAESHTQDTGKVIWALSRHTVTKTFAQQIGLRGASDTKITEDEYLWSVLRNFRSLGIQSLISELEIEWTNHQFGKIIDKNVTTRVIYIYYPLMDHKAKKPTMSSSMWSHPVAECSLAL